MGPSSGLTPKQQRFVDEYLIDLNATQAAIRAGYSPNNADVTGPRMLGNVGVAAAIAEKQTVRAEATELSEQWVMDRLKENVERSMVAVPVMVFNRDTKQMEETGEYTYQGNVANKALELIGKHRGMFVDRSEVKHGGTVQVKIVREGRRRTA